MTEDTPAPFGCFGSVGLLLFFVALTVGFSLDAAAHRPWFNDAGSPDPEQPYVLDDIEISQVIYGALEGPGRVDYYALPVPADFDVDVQIVVPDVAACAQFRPALAVFDPNSDPHEFKSEQPGTPAALVKGGDGVQVFVADDWGSFYEPFTGTTYATGPRWSGSVRAGDYLIAVYDPEGDAGTYGLSLGGSERSGGDPAFLAKIEPYETCTLPPDDGTATPVN